MSASLTSAQVLDTASAHAANDEDSGFFFGLATAMLLGLMIWGALGWTAYRCLC